MMESIGIPVVDWLGLPGKRADIIVMGWIGLPLVNRLGLPGKVVDVAAIGRVGLYEVLCALNNLVWMSLLWIAHPPQFSMPP